MAWPVAGAKSPPWQQPNPAFKRTARSRAVGLGRFRGGPPLNFALGVANTMSTQGRLSKAIVGVVVAWAVGAIVLAALFWPALPHTALGWAAFVVLGPAVYFVAEVASEAAWSSRAGRAISHHPSSLARIAGGVAVALVVFALSFGVSWFTVRH